MDAELVKVLQILLALGGGALQWVRQFKNVGDRWLPPLAVLVAAGVYALCFDYAHAPHWQGVLVGFLLYSVAAVPAVLGGTFTASSAAKAGAPVPMTNSR